MSHFFEKGAAEEVRILAERDWVIALNALPGWAVERALDELAVESKVRPTPAAARSRAEQLLKTYSREISRRKEAMELAALLPPQGRDEAAKARIQDLVNSVKKMGETK